MTEEQFWHSNPTIIDVYEQIWKERQNYENSLMYAYTGNYILSALFVAIDGVLNGKKATAKYISKPIRLFELTEEEKEKEKKAAIEQFMKWAEITEKKFERKEETDG